MGELARQPGCPELAATPLELLEPRPGENVLREEINRWIWPIIGGALGFGCAVLRNKLLYRPLWAGIHSHIILTGATAGGLIYIRDLKYASRTETDEVCRHYITLHPEDFPAFERKRYRDVYMRFYPVR